jgi:RNA polymerase sigma factor (sigma-70 family)
MKKVLVVDDESSITEGLVALFECENIEAKGAYDRNGAESILRDEFFPVILADLRLVTEADGIKLLENIREISPKSKVVSLTAFASPEVEEMLIERGSTMVLRKPMEFEQIIEIVGELIAEIEREAAGQSAKSGQPVDLEQLYTSVQRVLFSIPQKRYGMTPAETEELVQEAWCLYLQKSHGIQMPRPWLAGTIVNLCKQQIQQNSRHRERNVELKPAHEEEYKQDVQATDSTLIVQQALAQLDERSRRLCVLIGMEGWSYEEVSSELNLPIGSVGPLFIRAKKKLRAVVEKGH